VQLPLLPFVFPFARPQVSAAQLSGERGGRGERRVLGRVARAVPVEDMHAVDHAPRGRLWAACDAERAALDGVPRREVAPRLEHVEVIVVSPPASLRVGPRRDEQLRTGLFGVYRCGLDECGFCACTRWPWVADLGWEERGDVVGW
jgi:hypothetical protein